MSLPKGIYPTMITPFTDDNEVDYDLLEPLLRWYENRDCTGVFAVCQSSEMFWLSQDETMKITRKLMQLRRPNTVMLASGHVDLNTPDMLRTAQAIIAEGVDCYVFITNPFAAHDEDDDVLLRRVAEVTRHLGDFPLGFYECPSPEYKRLLTPYVIERLPALGNFVFLKDTCCNMTELRAKLAAAQGTALQIYNANSAMLLESLQAGCAGYSGVMGNFHPKLYAKLCACWQDEPALAQRIQAVLGITSAAEKLAYPICAKYHMQLQGVDMGLHTRTPRVDPKNFDHNARYVMRQMLQVTEALEDELGL
ncbi:MAG: dihydrodipicolinate synthase family protein [Oscillospiraceae bacterium]|nr:dihydrodipicolinate synthase family protein [Oscillospiraceae bacterium]